MRNPSPSLAAALAFALLAAASSRALAQEPPAEDVTGVVQGTGFTKIRIALPDPQSDAASSATAREIGSVLRDDLTFSGFFDVLEPVLYPLTETSPEKTLSDKWASIGAAAVTLSRLGTPGGRVDLRVRLLDTKSGTVLFDRRYGGTLEIARRVAHQISDDIVEQFTGRPGVSLTRIAFVSKHGEGKEIYVMDYDGARVRRITTSGTINLTPTWSPSADRMAFLSWRTGQPAVHLIDAEGRVSRVPTVAATMSSSPDWSPDGTKIVYTAVADDNAEIFLLDLTTGRNTRLTRMPSIETSPAFSPNGREIAFTSDRSGGPQIYIMDAEGLNVRRITTEGTYNDSAAWSPRGDRIAYASRVEGRFQIVVLELATGTMRQLTHQGNNENPRWSPDGRHIVFASNRTGRYDIWTMAADGSDPRRLTQGGDSFTPDWSRRP